MGDSSSLHWLSVWPHRKRPPGSKRPHAEFFCCSHWSHPLQVERRLVGSPHLGQIPTSILGTPQIFTYDSTNSCEIVMKIENVIKQRDEHFGNIFHVLLNSDSPLRVLITLSDSGSGCNQDCINLILHVVVQQTYKIWSSCDHTLQDRGQADYVLSFGFAINDEGSTWSSCLLTVQ